MIFSIGNGFVVESNNGGKSGQNVESSELKISERALFFEALKC